MTLAPFAARAQNAPPFPDLLKQALSAAPTSLEQRATVAAFGSDAAQARAWRNPSIDVSVENLNAPAADGSSQRQNTYSIIQPLELFGKRQARLDLADRNLDTARTRSQQVRVALAVELAQAYAIAEAAIQRSNLAFEELERAQDDLRAALALVSAGREASLRSAQAKASVSAAQAAERAAQADALQALEMLGALAGYETPFTGLASSLLDMPAPAPATMALGSYESPVVATARAERDALRAQVEIERRRTLPEVNVTAGARRYGYANVTGYQVGLTMSIPVFDRNINGIDAAERRVNAAEARLSNALLQSQAQRRSSIAQVEAAIQRLAAANEGQDAASEAYRLSRIGYEAGRTSLIELLTTRRALTEARLTTVDARLARVRAIALLAQSEGRLAFSGEIVNE